MKTEPQSFSFEDLENRPKKTEPWNGVRNYQARNFIRDEMKKGDIVLFYHSSCDLPGIPGLARITTDSYPDPTQFDKKSQYFDPKSTADNPRWYLVDVAYEKKFKVFVSLEDLKKDSRLSSMRLLQKGNRLSILPVTPEEFKIIKKSGSS